MDPIFCFEIEVYSRILLISEERRKCVILD
uniref:Uncharacterized protein n=1 Tax=Heterorhabditis bacteriophora TaxID=37862 RepID=A0A1I7WWC2_HETBA